MEYGLIWKIASNLQLHPCHLKYIYYLHTSFCWAWSTWRCFGFLRFALAGIMFAQEFLLFVQVFRINFQYPTFGYPLIPLKECNCKLIKVDFENVEITYNFCSNPDNGWNTELHLHCPSSAWCIWLHTKVDHGNITVSHFQWIFP